MSDSVHVGVEVFVGVDIAKGDHYACAVTLTGEEVLARSVRNDETAIRCLIDDAKVYGAVALVIDTTSSAASLLMETAARTQVPVAYVTGLAMRRAADLYAGAAKTDPKDALVLADYARRNADRLSWTQNQRRTAGEAAHLERTRHRPRRGRHPDRQQAQRRLVGPITSTGAGHRRQTGNQPRVARRVGVVAHAHSAQNSRPFPHSQPYSQTLTTRSPTTDRGDHRSARRAEHHSHSRNRLGRHHL